MTDRHDDIDHITDKLRDAWHEQPDTRLMQLLGNHFGASDPYYREDSEVEEICDAIAEGRDPDVDRDMSAARNSGTLENVRAWADRYERGVISGDVAMGAILAALELHDEAP